jgi:hypothetical protein
MVFLMKRLDQNQQTSIKEVVRPRAIETIAEEVMQDDLRNESPHQPVSRLFLE